MFVASAMPPRYASAAVVGQLVIAGLIGGISRAVTRGTEPTATTERPIADADGADLI